MAPVTGDAGDAGNRPYRHPSAAVPLETDADADAGRPRRGELLAQIDDRLLGKTADLRHAVDGELENAFPEGIPTQGMGVDEFAIFGAFDEHDVEQAQRQCGV